MRDTAKLIIVPFVYNFRSENLFLSSSIRRTYVS